MNVIGGENLLVVERGVSTSSDTSLLSGLLNAFPSWLVELLATSFALKLLRQILRHYTIPI